MAYKSAAVVSWPWSRPGPAIVDIHGLLLQDGGSGGHLWRMVPMGASGKVDMEDFMATMGG